MSSDLPVEFSQLEPQVEGMPASVINAFRFGLAQLLVEQGRLTDVPNGDDIVQFRTPAGAKLELSNPHLSTEQAQMVKTHLAWLLGLN